jgi:hypothetical protein
MGHLNINCKRDSLVEPNTVHLQANYQFLVNWQSVANASKSAQTTCHVTAGCTNYALWSPRLFPHLFQNLRNRLHGGWGGV